MATERLQTAETSEPKKPIYILDQGQPMPLWPKEINGVVVYTPTAEKTQELTADSPHQVPIP